MSTKPSPQGPAGAMPRQRPPTSLRIDPPRLWPDLTPVQRQQLAQCLAELIRRQRQPAPTPPMEAPHEPC